MPLEALANADRVSPFSDEDRVMHTTKMVERTFGVAASELGQVVVRDGQAVLELDHNGKKHTLAWRRQGNGAILWYANGSENGVILGGGERAIARLYNLLG